MKTKMRNHYISTRTTDILMFDGTECCRGAFIVVMQYVKITLQKKYNSFFKLPLQEPNNIRVEEADKHYTSST